MELPYNSGNNIATINRIAIITGARMPFQRYLGAFGASSDRTVRFRV